MCLTKCENGHFYDGQEYDSCPFCGVRLSRAVSTLRNENTVTPADDAVTVAMGDDDEVTVAMDGDDSVTAFIDEADDDAVTVGVFEKKLNGEPTVGWLVCTQGPEKGRDYRIKPSKNFIGRAAGMEIAVYDDNRISRSRHCCLIYDPKSNRFFASNGEGATAVNGKSLTDGQEIAEGDVLAMGNSEFMLIPFCKGERKWE